MDFVFASCDHRCHLTFFATRRHYEGNEKVADRRVAFVVRCDGIAMEPLCGRSPDFEALLRCTHDDQIRIPNGISTRWRTEMQLMWYSKNRANAERNSNSRRQSSGQLGAVRISYYNCKRQNVQEAHASEEMYTTL